MSTTAGILFGLGASASWALANVVVQRVGRAVGSLRGLFWAQVIGIGLAVLAAWALGERPRAPSGEDLLWIGVAGAASLGGYFGLFYAFEHGRLTLSVPIISSWAVISTAISLVLFGERLTAAQLVGAAAVISGAVVVGRFAQSADGDREGRGRWLPAALGAAIGFGILIPAMRRLSPVFGSVGTVGVTYAAGLVLALPLAAAFRVGLAPPRGRVWLLVALAGLFEAGGSACITLGARHAPLAIVSPLASLAATLTVLYAWAILRERPSRGVLVGAALVSTGVVVLAL